MVYEQAMAYLVCFGRENIYLKTMIIIMQK